MERERKRILYFLTCREYQIGVDVHRGRFQYQQTRVVTFVAHYQLENRTQYKLAYLQRHQLQHEVRVGEEGTKMRGEGIGMVKME